MVDGTGLENRHTLTGIGGSNPSLSARFFPKVLRVAQDFGARPWRAQAGTPSLPVIQSTVYAGLGDKEKALRLIEQAYREKSLDVVGMLKSDLRTDNLRSNPRFQNLTHSVGLPI